MPDLAGALDPSDWPAFRGFAHELLDSMLDRLQHAAGLAPGSRSREGAFGGVRPAGADAARRLAP
jgi:hypothetical protein